MTRFPALLCLVVLGLATAPGAARADEQGESSTIGEIVAALDADPPASIEETATRLADLGVEAVPALVQAWWDDAGRAAPGREGRRRDGPASQALGLAIERRGPNPLQQFLEDHLRENADDPTRLRVLETLARFGEKSMLGFAVQVAGDIDETWLQVPSVVVAWETALDAMLSGGWAPSAMITSWEELPSPLRAPSCRVLVERGRQADLLVVLELAARSIEDAPSLYEVLGRGSPIVLSRLGVHGHLRRHLVHREAAVRAAATAFLPRLRDVAAVPLLIERLKDEDARVRATAVAALRRISGMALGADETVWADWYAAEMRWLEESSVGARLAADDPVEVSRALQEVARHPALGGLLGEAVAELVQHEVVGIRLLACATLRGLDAPQAALALVDGLWDDDPTVRRAVWQTLKQLSGETLPQDGRAWAEARRRWRS